MNFFDFPKKSVKNFAPVQNCTFRVATVRENVREIGNVREKKLNVRENFGKVESQGIFVKCQGNLWIYM